MAATEFKLQANVSIAWWHRLMMPIWVVQLFFNKKIWIPNSMIKVKFEV